MLGYPVTLVMPENATEERKELARSFGAQVLCSPAEEKADGAIRMGATECALWHSSCVTCSVRSEGAGEGTAGEVLPSEPVRQP